MLLPLLLACSSDKAPDPGAAFPDGFLFGAATAGFQVDPGCPTLPPEECEDRGSDWYQWVTDPELVAESGLFLSGEPLSHGPGHWELWEDDLDRAAGDLHLRAFRLSIEWSRLFPDGEAAEATTVEELDALVDPDALAWYQAYFDGLAARGLEPVVTLNHYTLPLWVHDGKACHYDPVACSPAGWLDPGRTVPLITLFSAWCAAEFGESVRWWLTLNEPMGVVVPGFAFADASRSNPPGIADLEAALGVFEAMVLAHAAMADAVRAEDDDAMVGIVANVPVPVPNDPERALDQEGAAHMDYFINTMVLDAFVLGRFDDDLDGTADRTDAAVEGRTDWIGLNHYNVVPVIGMEEPLPAFGGYPIMDFVPVSTALAEQDSLEIGGAIDRVEGYGLPLWITEHGHQATGDDLSETWLLPNLETLRDRAEAADIRGYLYWSLIDNYEWNLGMEWKFGLYAVDVETKDRALRPLGATLGEVARTGRLP